MTAADLVLGPLLDCREDGDPQPGDDLGLVTHGTEEPAQGLQTGTGGCPPRLALQSSQQNLDLNNTFEVRDVLL